MRKINATIAALMMLFFIGAYGAYAQSYDYGQAPAPAAQPTTQQAAPADPAPSTPNQSPASMDSTVMPLQYQGPSGNTGGDVNSESDANYSPDIPSTAGSGDLATPVMLTIAGLLTISGLYLLLRRQEA